AAAPAAVPSPATPAAGAASARATVSINTSIHAAGDAPTPAAASACAGPADIAVVGLSCRFPDADDLDAFWQLLSRGGSALRRVPAERWSEPGDYVAAVLERATHFDPGYFLISAEDARA
ncbi:beta-ketoacyl synthase N-terminal-like domain-containing protein, partial [Burkholderia gladioli]